MATGRCSRSTEDLFYQILPWLPVISLLRFKSVCKSWYSLIQSSNFIHQHLNLHHHHPTLKDDHNLIILNPIYSGLDVFLLSGKNYEALHNLDLPYDLPRHWDESSKWSFQDYTDFTCGVKITSCNGIICLLHYPHGDVTMWNPATKQTRLLPKSSYPLLHFDRLSNDTFTSLVFDPITKDYKVVRFIFELIFPVRRKQRRVEVYSLSSDSWRNIDYGLPFDYILSDPKRQYKNGVYCWLGRVDYPDPENESLRGLRSIISFDTNKEVFETIELPEDIPHPFVIMNLGMLCENMACFHWDNSGENPNIKIWVFHEDGMNKTWEKRTIRLCGVDWGRPIGSCDRGIILMLTDSFSEDIKMCFCDAVSGELSNSPIQDYSRQYNLQVGMYKESLLPVTSMSG